MPAWEGVAVLCRNPDGRSLLMVLQGQPGETPTWAVPGGSIEPGETPEQAAVRETREETGLEVEIVRPYTVVEGIRPGGSFQVHYFEVQAVGTALRLSDPDWLIHQVAWVSASEIPGLDLSHAEQREILTSYMAELER